MPGLIKELSHNAFKCASLEMQKLDKRNMTNINNRNENATHTHTHTYANFMMCCGRKQRRGEYTVKTNNSVKSPVTYDKSQRKLEKHKRKTEERANNPEYPYEQPPPASSCHSTPPAKYFIASYEGQRNWNATETLTMTSSEQRERERERVRVRRHEERNI